MKIIFIVSSVGRRENVKYIDSWKMEPLTIATLASLTPPDIEVKVYDDRLEAIPYDEPADLVAITVETYTARRAYMIAGQFRKRGVKVIMGGYHPTLIPEETLEHADSIMIGEAENVWMEMIEDARNNRLKRTYRSSCRPGLVGIKPRRSVYADKKYMPISLIETSRGCSASCEFCSISGFFKQTHNFRPPKEVAREMEELGAKFFFLVDDNIISNADYAKELFKELTPLKVRWVSQCGINISNDRELLGLAKKSGCLGMLIGFESLNQQNLSQMKKTWNNSTLSFRGSMKVIREHGLAVYATFVFGYDHDDRDTFKRTVDFAIEQKFFLAAFNHLLPFPGTGLYARLKEEGRLLTEKWWLDPKYHYGDICFRPKKMTAEELSQYCLDARREFFRYSSMIKRGFDLKVNAQTPFYAALFFWTNMLLKKEVNQKRDVPFGEGTAL